MSSRAGQRRATLIGVAAIGLWSTLAVLTTTSAGIPPFQLLALTFAIGGGTSLLVLWFRGENGVRALMQPVAAFALTTAALFGYHALYFVALKTAPAIEANLINYLWPLLIVLLAALLPGERVRPVQYVGALMGLAGAVLIVTRGDLPSLLATQSRDAMLSIDPGHAAGYAAALGAALIWASYSVLNRRHAKVPSSAIAGPCLGVALLGAVAHLLLETTVPPAPMQWLAIVVMGAGPVGAAFWFWDIGTKRGELALLGTLAYAAPLLSTLWLLLAGQARLHWSHAAACLLIVGGGLLSVRASRNHGASPEKSAG